MLDLLESRMELGLQTPRQPDLMANVKALHPQDVNSTTQPPSPKQPAKRRYWDNLLVLLHPTPSPSKESQLTDGKT